MKNLKLFTLAVFAMISLLFVSASMAQTNTTGSVEGTVTDQNGAVVRGVTLTLSGPGLIREQTTVSDDSGNYRFSSVPPGRYTLSTAPISGFQASKQDRVEVNLTKSSTIDVKLTTTAVSGVVDVVAGAGIDQTANTTGASVSTEFFSNIPTSRTVQGLYTIAPTVARSGLRDASGRDRDPSVAGSSGPENSYILDGVTTTDPAFGGGGANLPFEFVQEVQVKTGSYGADQGLSTGGVFNVITKSGTNEFHGDAFAFFGLKSLVAKTKNFPQTGLAPNGFSEQDYGFDIGGPIVKNKVTFFAAINPQHRENFYLTQSFRKPASGKINTPFYSGKVTWQVNNNNVVNLSTFGDYTKEEGHLFAGSGFGSSLDPFAGTRETGGTNYSARWNSNFSSHFLGEFSFGVHRQRSNIIPLASQVGVQGITDNFAILKADGTVAN
ncbi:MAG TPA: TonB-dependent receptor, partial [Pyrinomonadaceae bacterium]|nr:TonB-dependent receptor [Pyrinomonadaceae bacterium]